ncbi:MAG: hypothetical protein K2N05_07955 [Muribaculaceae bacterium]|nr:hypothetical protein [Muribaculaceae bacterium]
MIKVAISGADRPAAGELIRILVNHPDVEIVALIAPGHEGKPVQSIHHGLLGEVPLSFTSAFKPAEADVLFVADKKIAAADLDSLSEKYPDLKIIALERPAGYMDSLTEITEEEIESYDGLVFALPEINRKPLVRGAKKALIPSPTSSVALVALYPLALNMLLSGDIQLSVSAPEDLMEEEALKLAAEEIASQLSKAQRSFNGKISFHTDPPSSKRGIEIRTKVDVPLDLEHILKTYDIYDDHNFSFTTISAVKLDDVKGTEKVIVSLGLTKEGTLSIHVVADGRLRGSAGEAVHVMNLMFGLHEKTGLYLKPYAF